MHYLMHDKYLLHCLFLARPFVLLIFENLSRFSYVATKKEISGLQRQQQKNIKRRSQAPPTAPIIKGLIFDIDIIFLNGVKQSKKRLVIKQQNAPVGKIILTLIFMPQN